MGGDGVTANANDIAIGQATIESIYKSDLVIGEDDETQIDFETATAKYILMLIIQVH